jgi:hypothetical protein
LPVITRDKFQTRTPIGQLRGVPPGESVLRFPLPANLEAGLYELEVVWSFGTPARESRDNFELR